jgi:hypothetical protein
MFTLRIWVFKSGVLKMLFILSKHGTKVNIKSTQMANNRHAYNRDVLVDRRRLLNSQCCLSTGLVANGIRLTKCCNALSSQSDVTRGLPDLADGK